MAGLGACTPPTTPTTPHCTTPTAFQSGFPIGATGAVPGWWTGDTRTNGNVRVDATFGAPAGFGCNAAVLTTGASTTPSPSQDKAQLLTFANAGVPFSSISNISYDSYRSSVSASGVADLALNVIITPDLANEVTLNFEPYENTNLGTIANNVWQSWNATNGVWWTTAIPNGTDPSGPAPGSQGNPQPWQFFQNLYGSTSLVVGYGFNIGSNNPTLQVAGDDLNFGGTITDF
jgi:hypothetical protein